MDIKLKDIMKMDEMKGAYYLAGSEGESRIVKSTTVLDAPDGIRFLKGRELVFSTMYPFSHLTNGLELIIQELALRNVSGLGLKLNRYLSKLPEPVIRIAEKYNFPIISLPPEKPWFDLMLPIMSEILEINNRQLMQSKEINHQFTKMLLSDSNLQHVAELLYYYIETPVSIINFTENYAVYFPNTNLPNKESVIGHLKSVDTVFKEIDSDTRLSTMSDNNTSYFILSFENHLKLKGVISIEKTKPALDSDDINTLLHAKNASILKIMHLQTEKEYNKQFKLDFVSRLLIQNIEKEEISTFRRRAWEMGFDLKDNYVTVALKISNIDLEQVYQFMDKLYQLKPIQEEALIGIDKENHIIILLPINVDNTYIENKKTINYSIDNLLLGINVEVENDWSIGVSQVQSIHSIPIAYSQCIKSLYHGIKVVGYKQVQFYDNLGIYRLFSHPALEEEMKVFVDELITPLILNDKEHQTELMETLKVFIENRGNYRKTAEILFIHHNTVRYRINNICELTDFDVNNYHTHLQYQLAFLFLPLLKR